MDKNTAEKLYEAFYRIIDVFDPIIEQYVKNVLILQLIFMLMIV